MNKPIDIRDEIFKNIADMQFYARITCERDGLVSGSDAAAEKIAELGIKLDYIAAEGTAVTKGMVIAAFQTSPKLMALAEDAIIGKFAKSSGIATAAQRAVKLAKGQVKIVSGSWKKMPEEIKQPVRKAIATGGASFRICDVPFIYLDKNYIRMFGDIPRTLQAVEMFREHRKVVQIRGLTDSIENETLAALAGGCDVFMVDTGDLSDISLCRKALDLGCAGPDKQIAFAGGVHIQDIPFFVELPVDILCIGREIVDAPLLDLKMDIHVVP
jgi:nicotinate-nucleotide pyrophosphorylase (carboxylating)